MRKPHIAVIGFGAIGRHHARNLANMSEVRFVGVVDSSDEARQRADLQGYRSFVSIDEVLREKLDGAVIAVPTSLHHGVALKIIRAGVAPLVEKPIASTIEHAMEIIFECKKRGVPLMVGYVERFNPAVIAAHQLLRDGLVGIPLQIATRRVGATPPKISDSNVIVDMAVHDVDIMSFLLQSKLRLISAQGGMAFAKDRIDYAILAMSAGSVVATAAVNWVTPVKVRDLTITGSAGYLHVDYLRQETRFAPGRNFVPTESYEALLAQYEEGTLVDCVVEHKEPLRTQLERFVKILQGAEPPDAVQALESLRIALEATEMINTALGMEFQE